MSEQEPWVVVWAVPKESLDTPCWLMVKHIERGWELPGGTISETESLDIAASVSYTHLTLPTNREV